MRNRGTLRFGLSFAVFFAALSLVVWRQSRALETLRTLDTVRTERAILESERTALQRQIQELEGRERIVQVAGERLGLHAPSASELVILRLPREVEMPPREGRLALGGGRP